MMSNPLTPHLQAVVYQLLRNITEIDEHSTADYSVTVAQSYGLLAIPADQPIVMGHLSQQAGLSKSAATRMVDQLAKRGLVERSTDPEDRRSVQVQLTPQGQTLRAQLEADYAQFFDKVLALLPDSQQSIVVDSIELLVGAIMEVMRQKYADIP